jgi:glycosyltransferase involved in cell wall biosynthesis
MSTTPRLTIGLPVYNGDNYLAESLEALLGQSYEDFELIISDNASTDGTADICHCYEKQDFRIRYFRQPRNIGLAPNRTFLISRARGELFKEASHDDLYGRDLLKLCVAALDEYPHVVLAHSRTAAIDGDSKVTQALDYPLATDSPKVPERFRSVLFGSSGLFGSQDAAASDVTGADNDGIIRADDQYGVIRTDVLRRIAPLGSYHHADRVVVPEIVLHGPFYQVPEWLYFRRDHPDRAEHACPTVRTRCTNLDPRRADRLRNPTPRLVAEYFWGYIAAIRRAPLSAPDRQECYRVLMQWMANRAVSRVRSKPSGQSAGHSSGVIGNPAVSVEAVVAGQGGRV